MGKKLFRILIHSISLLLLVSFIILAIQYLNFSLLIDQSIKLITSPLTLIVITGFYLLAFILRAVGWKLYLLNDVPLKVYVSALFYSLFFNHVLPFKAGEAVRVGVLAQNKGVSLEKSVHSVIVMRLLDLFVLGFFSAIGAFWLGVALNFAFLKYSLLLFIGMVFLLVLIVRKTKLPFVKKQIEILMEAIQTKRGLIIVIFVLTSWLLEAAVVFGIVLAFNEQIGFFQAVWINSLTVASSVFQFAPGGFASYESVMSFALVQFDLGWEQALNLALITHGYKYLFSFVAGFVAYLLFPITWKIIKSWFTKKGALK